MTGRGRPAPDLVGRRYDRLTVIARAENNKWRNSMWDCVCDCGKTVTVVGSRLGKDHRSCGCLAREALMRGEGRFRPQEVVKYNSAHWRVRRARGPAREYPCVDCGGAASDWSYNKDDPDELLGLIVLQDGREIEAPYSVNPDHYSPRCRSCHVRFDA